MLTPTIEEGIDSGGVRKISDFVSITPGNTLRCSYWFGCPGSTGPAKCAASRLLSRIDKMLSMRLPAAPGCRGAGRGPAGHANAQGLVVAVDGGPVCRFASHARAADAGEDGCDDMVAEGEQRDHGPAGVRWDVVTAGPAGFVDQLLAAELAQVVSGLPGGVAVLPGDLADPCGVLAPRPR